MEREHNSTIPEELIKVKARTVTEMEQWAEELHKLGCQCRLPVGYRETMTIHKEGYEYQLVEGDPDRRTHGIDTPCFMGYEGFALRGITKHKMR